LRLKAPWLFLRPARHPLPPIFLAELAPNWTSTKDAFEVWAGTNDEGSGIRKLVAHRLDLNVKPLVGT